jgi:hypothetical protein
MLRRSILPRFTVSSDRYSADRGRARCHSTDARSLDRRPPELYLRPGARALHLRYSSHLHCFLYCPREAVAVQSMMPPEEPRRELRRRPLLGGSMSFKEGALSCATFVAQPSEKTSSGHPGEDSLVRCAGLRQCGIMVSAKGEVRKRDGSNKTA